MVTIPSSPIRRLWLGIRLPRRLSLLSVVLSEWPSKVRCVLCFVLFQGWKRKEEEEGEKRESVQNILEKRGGKGERESSFKAQGKAVSIVKKTTRERVRVGRTEYVRAGERE